MTQSPSFPFDWVDAFTDQPFGGNGCAVVYDDGQLDLETCLKFTRETGLVECTFVGPSEVADLKIRYFFPTHEIPFAGHPTVATICSALSRGMVAGPNITIETGAGAIPIEVSDDSWITMTQNAPVFGDMVSPEKVAGAVGLRPDDIIGSPQIVSTGLPFVVTLLRDHEALRRAKVDVAALATFQKDVRLEGAPVMEPYLTTLGGATPAGKRFHGFCCCHPARLKTRLRVLQPDARVRIFGITGTFPHLSMWRNKVTTWGAPDVQRLRFWACGKTSRVFAYRARVGSY